MTPTETYVKYFGGLGNQLFQYNFSKYLESRIDSKVSMLRSRHLARSDRRFDLDAFLEFRGEEFRHPPFSMNFSHTKVGNFLATQVDKLGLTTQNYDQLPFEFLRVSSSRHFFPLSYSGYFQNFAYVEGAINNYIDPLMAYIDRISVQTRHRLKLGQETPIVHVRRGDLNRPENRWMGTLGVKYIADALDRLNLTSSDAVIFTDDVEGTLDVQEAFGGTRLIGPEDTSAWETLAVFATSSNLVMANSTLSWWGGYLASRSGSRVIMPDQWFRDLNRSPGERLHIPGVERINAAFS